MARTEHADSRNLSVYLDIRRNLLRGAFPAGHRFKLAELCETHGASVSVVREALTRLTGQGLVVLEPNKGFSVPELSESDINDVAFLRSEIEALAVRRSIELGDPEWEARVVAAHHLVSVLPSATLDEDPEVNERWTLAHRAFHDACASGCGSPRLSAVRAQLYDQSEVMRQLAKLQHDPRRNVVAEHAAIAGAIVARDADKTTSLLRQHIDATRRASLRAINASPPDVADNDAGAGTRTRRRATASKSRVDHT